MRIEIISVFRFDFVLEANAKADIYQMRFGGLFDCSMSKAHGLAMLIYDNSKNEMVISTYLHLKLPM